MQTSVALALSANMPFDDWRALGFDIAAQHRNISWLAGDWYNFGTANYGEQAVLDLPEFGDGAAKLKAVAKVADTFQPSDRDVSLSFDHYKHLSELPYGEARKLLERAKSEKLLPCKIRIEAIKVKVELGQSDFIDDDYQYQEQTKLVRLWNNSSHDAKLSFLALAKEAAESGVMRIDG